ncbi:Aim23p [Kluyveromyces lactis]|uniref:Altered inheritance of mitochondria protein 23, mitochondrial n=1 Tax=Kluyveromyces lactis (strain ATCC 8585 / CBS 2359 / DSM 70799 / NBRC 1267 / NRRL Y-1140 / WM37) TaxID=284590 RepID=AIM23_KLULA|nr:uncharacterized protein KLLA0_E15379g [Kluyveromyces lactis]Q6CN45.1 RecName: Full=Altered inheritance of mitochondria protein 23, mitochondrial; Flags: Precursor [Kluyveromyces lactis NRRL Y-1140]CAG99731.1 KLLA0E15379p [Kluyveromyces lactis]|eukprot:XP_454644.1 uncharacterized protein KLLA0_E15379g [Kluyveromyces lactis]
MKYHYIQMLRTTFKYSISSIRLFCNNRVLQNESRAVSDLLFNLPTYNPATHRKSGNNSPHKNRDKHRHRNGNKDQRNKKLVFRWNSGTEKQQAAANSVLEEILAINSKGNIKAINPETSKLEEANIRNFLKGVNLEINGIAMVSIDNAASGDVRLPIVKEVPTRQALKNYSDKLSKIKEEELIKLGVNIKKTGRRSPDSKADSSWKSIKVSWQISDYDLKKQKCSEIVSNLEKGSKIALFINDKDSSNLSPIDEEELEAMQESSISKKEMKRREEVLEKLNEIISEYSSQITQEGLINQRIIMKVTPNLVNTNNGVDKKALKEQRKRERQEKLQRRIEKKKTSDSTE